LLGDSRSAARNAICACREHRSRQTENEFFHNNVISLYVFRFSGRKATAFDHQILSMY